MWLKSINQSTNQDRTFLPAASKSLRIYIYKGIKQLFEIVYNISFLFCVYEYKSDFVFYFYFVNL